jgi:hypothetical protein
MREFEVNDLRLHLAVLRQGQESDGYRQLKPARTAGAGIEVEHAFFRVVIRHVGVAVEDGGEFGCSGIEMESFEIVQHVEVEARVRRIFDEDDFSFRELGAGAVLVDVAADGGDRSDFGELVEDGDFADVTDMEDAVDAAKCGSDFGSEKAVGVADDAEEHEVRIAGLAELAVLAELGCMRAQGRWIDGRAIPGSRIGILRLRSGQALGHPFFVLSRIPEQQRSIFASSACGILAQDDKTACPTLR